jgi:putative NADH-flavin reductase
MDASMQDPQILTVALFGGSGATGRQVIAHALRRGLQVRALVRPGSSAGELRQGLECISGSLLESRDVDRTIAGTAAVCSVFGPRPPYTDVFCAAATGQIVRSMERFGVTRILCLTGAMIGGYHANRTWPFRLMTGLFRRQMPAIAGDRAEQERIIQESGLEWTLLKPPRLTNGPRSRQFHAAPDLRVGLLSSVSRQDLADFIVEEILAPRHPRQVLFLSGG